MPNDLKKAKAPKKSKPKKSKTAKQSKTAKHPKTAPRSWHDAFITRDHNSRHSR